jgi:hypothetical protein
MKVGHQSLRSFDPNVRGRCLAVHDGQQEILWILERPSQRKMLSVSIAHLFYRSQM